MVSHDLSALEKDIIAVQHLNRTSAVINAADDPWTTDWCRWCAEAYSIHTFARVCRHIRTHDRNLLSKYSYIAYVRWFMSKIAKGIDTDSTTSVYDFWCTATKHLNDDTCTTSEFNRAVRLGVRAGLTQRAARACVHAACFAGWSFELYEYARMTTNTEFVSDNVCAIESFRKACICARESAARAHDHQPPEAETSEYICLI